MPAEPKNFPRVSFIMPTLNAEAMLENCLASIARQTYPREKIEIILADAHSTDRTREIAKKYGALVLDDDGKNMEEGKRLALRHATGEFIVFVDADNEITHRRLSRAGRRTRLRPIRRRWAWKAIICRRRK